MQMVSRHGAGRSAPAFPHYARNRKRARVLGRSTLRREREQRCAVQDWRRRLRGQQPLRTLPSSLSRIANWHHERWLPKAFHRTTQRPTPRLGARRTLRPLLPPRYQHPRPQHRTRQTPPARRSAHVVDAPVNCLSTLILRSLAKIVPRWKHSAPQQFPANIVPHFLCPVHPAALAQAEKMPHVFVRREPEVVKAEQYHARSPIRPIERLLPCQDEVRHPFVEPRTKVRPPQEFPRVLPVQRGNATLGLQHFACAAINFPADIKRQLRFYAHGSSAAAHAVRACCSCPPSPTPSRALGCPLAFVHQLAANRATR